MRPSYFDKLIGELAALDGCDRPQSVSESGGFSLKAFRAEEREGRRRNRSIKAALGDLEQRVLKSARAERRHRRELHRAAAAREAEGLRDWYRRFGEAVKNGELTADEASRLEAEWNRVAQPRMERLDAIAHPIGTEIDRFKRQGATV